MSAHTTHPLSQAWLRDLELLLHGIDPGERAEVLAGVHEHLDGSLPPDAGDDDVRRVLADLGSPQSVADEAHAGRPTSSLTGPATVPTDPPRWQAVTACVLNVLGLALLCILTMFAMGAAEIVVGGIVFALPWCAIAVLSVLSPVWTVRQRTISVLLYPVSSLVLGTVSAVMMVRIGPSGAAPIPVLVVVIAGASVLVHLLRCALREVNRSAR